MSSRHPNKVKNISEIKVREQTITEPSAIAQKLNLHFSSIGERLASEIPSSNVEHECYLEPTEATFSMKAPTVNVVRKLLLKLNERKDNIPSNLLKMAANIVAPSLTQIFTKSISTGIFPTEWKFARVTPIFSKGKRDDPNNHWPMSIITTSFTRKSRLIFKVCYFFLINSMHVWICNW